MKIAQTSACCTVIVTVDGTPSDIAAIKAHATEGLRHFQRYEGFIGGATHLSADKSRLVQYVQWKDNASHAACQADPAWEKMAGARQFMGLVESDRITVRVDVYEVIAQRDSP